jgi:hypothetical protein
MTTPTMNTAQGGIGAKSTLKLVKGTTFVHTLRLAGDTLVYRPIAAASQAAPCILTVPGHGLADGWPLGIEGALGMPALNSTVPAWVAQGSGCGGGEYVPGQPGHGLTGGCSDRWSGNSLGCPRHCLGGYTASMVDADHLALEGINATAWPAYTGGGQIRYRTPLDLTGCAAHLQIRTAPNDAIPLLDLTVANGRMVVDTTAHSITAEIAEADTVAIPWSEAAYDLMLIYADGTVQRLLYGTILALPGVTR